MPERRDELLALLISKAMEIVNAPRPDRSPGKEKDPTLDILKVGRYRK
jgi:hypothetical protein